MIVDPDEVATIIADIAEQEMMPKFRNLSPDAIREKSTPNDLVTEVDEIIERRLSEALLNLLPGSKVVGEESVAADPSSMNILHSRGAVWIVDPLDGTRNFIRGRDEFGTIAALVVDGETQLGWIYAAPERTCAIGVKNQGVRWTGQPIENPRIECETYFGMRNVGWLTDEWRETIVTNLKRRLTSTSSHCSAYAYLKLLTGEADFKISSRIHPWDHAAGALMVKENGGRVSFLDDGATYDAAPTVDRPLLASRNADTWDHIADELRAPVASS